MPLEYAALVPRLALLVFVLALLSASGGSATPAYCTGHCAIYGAQAYQPQFSEASDAMGRAASGQVGYPTLPSIKQGYPDSTAVPGSVPCIIVKAVGWVESSWRQAYPSVPRGSSGDALMSYGGGCGYGIMQITSGMHASDTSISDEDQWHIAEDYAFNVAWGTKVLVEKWNAWGDYGAVVGSRDPTIAEDWYFGVWGYNGFTFGNNPNNPDYDEFRPPFDGSQSRSNYPYQEIVWGFAANPPIIDGAPLWTPISLTLPDRAAIGSCAYGAECSQISRPSPSHLDPCASVPNPSLIVDAPDLVFLSDPGGPARSRQMTIREAQGGSLAWTASTTGGSWLTVGPASGGSTPATITLTVNPAGLAAGIYTGNVHIEAQGAASGSPIDLAVKLVVGTIRRGFLPAILDGLTS